MSLYTRIYRLVRLIPPGNVSSYGKLAQIVGTGARQVGYAMAAVTTELDVPWHRVVNSRGELSARKGGKADERQRQRLIEEGVIFDARGRIDLDQFSWIEAEIPGYDFGFDPTRDPENENEGGNENDNQYN